MAKSKFGPSQLNNPTPEWAKWMFRVTFLLTTVAIGYIAATNLLSQEVKYETTLVLKLVLDPLVFGLSKLFGVSLDETQKAEPALRRIYPKKTNNHDEAN